MRVPFTCRPHPRTGSHVPGVPVVALRCVSATVNHPDLCLLLIDHFGWTPQQYRDWLVNTTARLLLGETGP